MKQTILISLQKSLLPNTQLLKQAQEQLSIISKAQIVIPLMDITTDLNIDSKIRQGALVLLKQSVQNRWKPNPLMKNEGKVYLTLNQKSFIKDNMLAFFLKSESKPEFNKLLQYIVKTIIKFESKEWMPNDQLIAFIQNTQMSINNIQRILQFVLSVSSAFQYGKNDNYTVFCYKILPMFQKYLTGSSLKIIYLFTKIFWKSINGYVNPYFQQKSKLWLNFVKLVIDYHEQSYYNSISKIDKNTNQFYYFHAKKWATRCIMKILLPQTQSKLPQSFKTLFHLQCLPSFIQSILVNLTIPCIDKLKYFQLRFLFYSLIKSPQYFKNIRNELQYNILIPFIKSNKLDFHLVKDNPLQYLSKQEDDSWGFTNIRMAALLFWVKLVNSQCIQDNLKWLSQKIKSNNIEQIQLGLNILINMSTLQDSTVISIVSPVLQYMVNMLSDGEMLIRYRILELITRYPTTILTSNLLQLLLQSIVTILMTSANQLLIYKSLQSFNLLIPNHQQAILLIKPYINLILKELLKTMALPDSEDLIPILYQFVLNLKHYLGQYIFQLSVYFSQQFLRFSKQYNDDQTSNGVYDRKMEDAATACISILDVLFDSATEDILINLEPCIVKVMEECFTENGLEHYEDGLELLNTYLFKTKAISSRLLFFYPCLIYKLIQIPDSVSYENIPIIVQKQTQIFDCLKQNYNLQAIQKTFPVLRNYIYKCPQVISQNTDFFNNKLSDLLIELVKTIYNQSKAANYLQCIEILSLWSVVIYLMQNCQNTILLRNIIEIIYSQDMLSKSGGEYLQKIGCQLWCMCAFRQPQSMLRVINIQSLQFGVQHSNTDYQNKRILLGLATIIGNQNILNNYQTNRVSITTIVELIKRLKTKRPGVEQLEQQQQQLQFSQKLDQKYISNIQNIDQNSYFVSCLRIFEQKCPQLANQLKKLI